MTTEARLVTCKTSAASAWLADTHLKKNKAHTNILEEATVGVTTAQHI